MSPIKAQTLFFQMLDDVKAHHADHIQALMDGQAEFKKAAGLIERIQHYLGETELELHGNYCGGCLDLVTYANHCGAQQQAVFDACVSTGLPFSLSESHSAELRDLIFDGCTMRIVFSADVVSSMQESA